MWLHYGPSVEAPDCQNHLEKLTTQVILNYLVQQLNRCGQISTGSDSESIIRSENFGP